MPYVKKNNVKRGAKKATRKPKANGLKVSKPVINPLLRSYVKRMINGEVETKFFTEPNATQAAIQGSGFNTTGPFGWTSIRSLIPIIQQGVGPQQRNGNQISPVGKLLVRGYVLALPTDGGAGATNPFPNCPFYVRIVVWRQRGDIQTRSNSEILDDNLTAGGKVFDGTLDDLQVPFNKDKFVIGAVKQFMLQPNSSNIATNPLENLSGFPISKQFKLYLDLPNKIIYNDTGTTPQNACWYMSAGIVMCDGTIATNNFIRARITATTTMKFKDA